MPFVTENLNDWHIEKPDGTALIGGPELPPEPETQDYSQVPPTPGEALSALRDTGPSTLIQQAAQRGMNADASLLDRFLSPKGIEIPLFGAKAEQPDLLDPATANERYAPKGQTWFDKPISDGLAQVVAQQRRDNEKRDATIARFEQTHSWPAILGANVVGSMMDPANVAAAFVPGVGEEAIATRLGGGVVARMAGRTVSGAIGGAAGSLPNVAAHGALDDNYSLREAFLDLAMGAASGAVLQGLGEGGLREAGVLRPDALMRGPASAITAPAAETHAAISAAVAQTVEGQPVDVVPILHPPATDLQVSNVRLYMMANGIKGVPEDVVQRAASILGRGDDVDFALNEALKEHPPTTLAQVAEQMKQQVAEGFAPGVTREDYLRMQEEVNAAATAKPAESEPAGPKPAAAGEAGAPASEAEVAKPDLLAEVKADPKLQEAIANPQINRANDVPYGAGASKSSHVTNIDPHVPETATIDGVTFDTSIPTNIHEQYEKTAMDILIARGMSESEAYVTAHHLVAEKAEREWVEAQGINWDHYQHWWNTILPGIEHENPANPPPDLYTKVYPHDRVEMAQHEPTGPVSEPTPAEKAAAGDTDGKTSAVEAGVGAETKPAAPIDPEVAAAQAELAKVVSMTDAFAQAAQCLVEAGI